MGYVLELKSLGLALEATCRTATPVFSTPQNPSTARDTALQPWKAKLGMFWLYSKPEETLSGRQTRTVV